MVPEIQIRILRHYQTFKSRAPAQSRFNDLTI